MIKKKGKKTKVKQDLLVVFFMIFFFCVLVSTTLVILIFRKHFEREKKIKLLTFRKLPLLILLLQAIRLLYQQCIL